MLRPSAVLCPCKLERASPLSPEYHRQQPFTLTCPGKSKGLMTAELCSTSAVAVVNGEHVDGDNL